MDSILDVIKKRRSIRKYKDKPLSKDTILLLLEAAKYAPTARNLQQLEYKVITNKDLIQKISDGVIAVIARESPSFPIRQRSNLFYYAPLLIIISAPAENVWIYSDAALAVENIMLYASSINLGTCFIGLARFIGKDKDLMHELNIPEDKKIAAAVVCGYPDEEPPEKEKRMKAEFFY
jgi:nitroreductase